MMDDGSASDGSGKNKRTRFADDITVVSVKEAPVAGSSPKESARAHVQAYTETLQEKSLASMLVAAAEEYLSERSRLFYKERKLSSMKINADFIPKSAKIALVLDVTDEAKKTQEFESLEVEAAAVIESCRQELKKLVVKTTELNVAQMKTSVKRTFAKSLRNLANGFLTLEDVTTYDADCDRHWIC